MTDEKVSGPTLWEKTAAELIEVGNFPGGNSKLLLATKEVVKPASDFYAYKQLVELRAALARELEQRFGPLVSTIGTAMDYEVVADTKFPSEWRVEAINFAGDGDIYVALFSGPDAEIRAREYAAWKQLSSFSAAALDKTGAR